MSATEQHIQKREHDGRYAFDGDLSRLCVCRHSLAVHSAGSPADCLLYSFSDDDPLRASETAPVDCGCKRFRLSRRKVRTETKLQRIYLCQCDLIHETEKQARNCPECGPRTAYLCSICSEPRMDPEAAVRCCKLTTCEE